MKKLFCIFAFLAVVSLSARSQAIPAEMQQLITELEDECRADQNDEMKCGGIFVEGHDVVMVLVMDESKFDGMPLEDAFIIAGVKSEDLAAEFKKEMLEDQTEEAVKQRAMLKNYQYNLVIRMQGTPSGSKIDCRLNYQDL